jgi:hypothetical protein
MQAVAELPPDTALATVKPTYYRAVDASIAPPVGLPPASAMPLLLSDAESPAVQRILERFVAGWGAERPTRLVPIRDEPQVIARYAEARGLLADLFPEVVPAIDLLLRAVLFCLMEPFGYGGASLGEAIGVVWIRPDPAWAVQDFAECVLHESVHQSLLLSDWAVGLFTDQALGDGARLPSAIRILYPSGEETLRSYIPAYHAAVVATALLQMYEALGEVEKAWGFRRSLRLSLPHLGERTDLLTVDGQRLLAEVSAIAGRRRSSSDHHRTIR